MKIVLPSSALITETNPFSKIELAGRTCYKSTEKMTDTSSKAFYSKMVKNGHVAMLEHATFVFQVEEKLYRNLLGVSHFLNMTSYRGERFIISGNLRAINETPFAGDLLRVLYDIDPLLVYRVDDYPKESFSIPLWGFNACLLTPEQVKTLTPDEKRAHTYVTFHWVTDRGVTHEIVRHRPASYAQESTRYCNYGKGNGITVVPPYFSQESNGACNYGNTGGITVVLPSFLHDNTYRLDGKPWNVDEYHMKYSAWLNVQECSERNYIAMISMGCAPQEARSVLTNSLKTEIIMTANAVEFDHFFDLRYFAKTGSPHPDMKYLTTLAYPQYISVVGERDE